MIHRDCHRKTLWPGEGLGVFDEGPPPAAGYSRGRAGAAVTHR